MKYNLKKHLMMTAATGLALMFSDAAHAQQVAANQGPTGGSIVRGDLSISATGSATTITQRSDKAIINWNSFSIGSDAVVNINQNSVDAIILNRVLGDDISQIFGRLNADGKVFLINRNGIIFGKDSVVNVGGLVASTSNIEDDDFWSGRYHFDATGVAGAKIINNGTITIKDSGLAAFVAPYIVNNGVINARLGRVALGATDNAFSLDLYGDNLIKFAMTDERASEIGLGENSKLGVDMSGKIIAEGGTIAITADLAREVVSDVITLNGEVRANSITQDGGDIVLSGGQYGNVAISEAALIDASGVKGGDVEISGNKVSMNGTIIANGDGSDFVDELSYLYNHRAPQEVIDIVSGWSKGGEVTIDADVILLGGNIDVNGVIGGSVDVSGRNVMHYGSVESTGYFGQGGNVSISASNSFLGMLDSMIAADGLWGGSVDIRGGANIYYSGNVSAAGFSLNGGDIRMSATKINLVDASFYASGATNGGQINIGFDGDRSDPDIIADSITVSPHSVFNANAGTNGQGGVVNFWSQTTTNFSGHVKATGGSISGDGGFVEISSKGEVGYQGLVDASAANGENGTLLLDPKNLIIGTVSIEAPTYFHFFDPNVDAGTFGKDSKKLANGNIVISDPLDDFVATDAGAVYLFDGTTYGLISTLTGSTANDKVSEGRVTVLNNGNFVVSSPNWDNGGFTNAGAVTWVNGSTGITGIVSTSNSLVGSKANDTLSKTSSSVFPGVVALTNGNYVVVSPFWDNGSTANVGAATWGNGTTGLVGTVSSSNSLIGGAASSQVAYDGVTALTNGNYVVVSHYANVNGIHSAGAVTWGNGSTGSSGIVNSSNSIYGTKQFDEVGDGGITVLSNGNYVVSSKSWATGTADYAGAATWGNGSTGTVGAVSASNSLVGSRDTDRIGYNGITALTNGNYVVSSSLWDNGSVSNAGASTWGNGSTGTSGVVSASNSLVGNTPYDAVGSFAVALTNGNYVAISRAWKDGAGFTAGAATWVNGNTGIVGTISASNSLVGSTATGLLGSGGVVITALSNGNYVVGSPSWKNSSGVSVGASTWANGSTGLVGLISSANSLVGSRATDGVGNKNFALTNGNYVVSSYGWSNSGSRDDLGAATWGNGSTGTVGIVSASNSLIGNKDGDQVGYNIIALTNGNYAVSSRYWNNGSATDAGAVTWGNGNGGTVGVVSTSNSLVGSSTNDKVGEYVVALTNGNFVVGSRLWDNGGVSNAGAITWGDGYAATVVGEVSTLNSLTGVLASDYVGWFEAYGRNAPVVLDNNTVLVGQDGWNDTGRVSLINEPTSIINEATIGNINFSYSTGDTLRVDASQLTDTLDLGTNLVLQANNDITVNENVIVNNASGDGGDLTLQAGRSIFIDANITTDNGNLTLIANETSTNGVVDADRDEDAAVITMGSGYTIDAGTGAVTFTLSTGAGNTNSTSGDITLETVTGGTVVVENYGTDNGDVLTKGVITASGAGDAIILRTGGDYINTAGASALSASSGRFIVFVNDVSNITSDGLSATNWYNTAVNASEGGVTGTGNRFVSAETAILTVTAQNKSRDYGASNPVFTQNVTGYINGENSSILTGSAGNASSTATATTNVGSETITATNGTLGTDLNYTIATAVDGTLTINKATLSATATNDSFTYDGTGYSGGNGVVYSGFVNGDTSSVVNDTGLSYVCTSQGAVNAGAYVIAGSGLTASNYDFNYQNGALTIDPAALSITSDNQTVTYGDSLGTTAFTHGSLIGSEAIDNVVLNSSNINVGSYTDSIIASGATGSSGFLASNYDITYNPGDLTVTKKSLTVSAAADNTTYNGLSYSGGNGVTYSAFAYSENSSILGGTLGYVGTSQGAVDAGTFLITPEGYTSSNYSFIYQDANLTVGQASLSIAATDQSKTYGDNLSLGSSLFTSNGLQNGETIGSVNLASANSYAGTVTTNAGTYTDEVVISAATGGTFNAANYAIAYVEGDLAIDKKNVAVTATDETITYDGNFYSSGNGIVYSGFVNGDTSSVVNDAGLVYGGTSQGAVNAGSYVITGSGLTASNYDFNYINGALTIDKAALSITANNQTVIYGDAYNTADFIHGALIGSEVIDNVVLNSSNINVGTYTDSIIASGATGSSGFLNSNYDITYNTGDLTVTKKVLTVSAVADSKTYDGLSYSGGNGITYSAFAYSENSSALGGTLGYTGTSQGVIDAGTFLITPEGYTSSNYSFIYQDANLTVNQAALSVTATDQSKTYGDNLSLGSSLFTSNGLQNGETIGSVNLTSANSYAGTVTTGAGTYSDEIVVSAATGGTFNVANYAVTYVDADLTIDKKTVDVTASDDTVTYNGNAYSSGNGLSYDASGFVNSDTSSVVNEAGLVYGGTSQGATNAGSYVITGSGLTASNYDFNYTNGALTIDKAALSITADDQTLTYGDSFVTTAFTHSALIGSEAVDNVTLNNSNINAGFYTDSIIASGVTGSSGFLTSNYDITYNPGDLTVTKKSLTVSAVADGKTYDGLSYSGGNGVTYSAFAYSENSNILGGTLGYSGTSQGAINAATYVITPEGYTSGNYSFVYQNENLTVNQAALTITAGDQSLIYGDNLDQSIFSHSILIGSETVGSALLSKSGVNVGTYNTDITASGALGSNGFLAANYAITYVGGDLTIGKKTVTVTANDDSKTYDGAAYSGGNGISYSNDFAYGETSSVVNEAGLVYSGTSQGAINAGSYVVASSGLTSANYDFSYIDGTLTVNKAALTVTANDQSVTYGDALGTTGFTHSALIGSQTLDNVALNSANINAGTYVNSIIASSVTGSSGFLTSNYDITYNSSDLTVNKKLLTITAVADGKTYDGLSYSGGNGVTYSAFAYSENSSALGGTLNYSGTSQGAIDAGNYIIAPQGYSSSNYSFDYQNAGLTVDKAALSITADDRSKVYGDSLNLGTLSFSSIGLQNGETVGAVTLISVNSASGTATTGAGNYSDEIVSSAAAGGTFNSANYTIVYNAGDLSIEKAALTIAANDDEKTYDGIAYDNGNGVIYDGFVNGENENALGGELLFSGTASEAVHAGDYIIEYSGQTSDNYELTYTNGQLVVNKYSLTVSADDQEKMEHQDDPVLTYLIASGSLILNDEFTGLLSRGEGEISGDYEINQGDLNIDDGNEGGNYDITFETATLTIISAGGENDPDSPSNPGYINVGATDGGDENVVITPDVIIGMSSGDAGTNEGLSTNTENVLSETNPLVVSQPMVDIIEVNPSGFTIELPINMFEHFEESATISIDATLPDGSALPQWITYNQESNTLVGSAPSGVTGTMTIVLTATDAEGNSAETTVTIQIVSE